MAFKVPTLSHCSPGARALARISGRWYLLVGVLPWVTVACLLRQLAWTFAPQPCLFDSDAVATFSNSAVFVIAIILSGVLEDYSEAESMPGAIAAELDAISTKVTMVGLLQQLRPQRHHPQAVATTHGGPLPAHGGPQPLNVAGQIDVHGELLSLLEGIFCYLAGLRNDASVMDLLDSTALYTSLAVANAHVGLDMQAVREHFNSLRKILHRLHVIQRTDFVSSGYSLSDLLIALTICLTILGRSEHYMVSMLIVAFTALHFLFVKHLVHDIDAPFSYAPEDLLPVVRSGLLETNHPGGSASIDLFPLLDALQRLRAKVAARVPVLQLDAEGLIARPSATQPGGTDVENRAAHAFISKLARDMAEAEVELKRVGSSAQHNAEDFLEDGEGEGRATPVVTGGQVAAVAFSTGSGRAARKRRARH